jgi:Flp pilus assembly protein TadG
MGERRSDMRGAWRAAARGLRRLGAAQDGTAAVEFAMVATALVLLVFGVFEFGRAMWTQSMLDFAVEQASRCASVDTTTCTSAATTASYASAQTAPLNLPAATFTATTATCGNKVTASYAFTFVTANLFPYAITLTSQSCFPL